MVTRGQAAASRIAGAMSPTCTLAWIARLVGVKPLGSPNVVCGLHHAEMRAQRLAPTLSSQALAISDRAAYARPLGQGVGVCQRDRQLLMLRQVRTHSA